MSSGAFCRACVDDIAALGRVIEENSGESYSTNSAMKLWTIDQAGLDTFGR